MAATQIGNVANLLFHGLMGRKLSTVEYGVLGAMLNLILVVVSPLDALRTSLAHYTARLANENNKGAIRHLVGIWFKRTTYIGVLLLVVGIVSSEWLAEFFKLTSLEPLMVTLVILVGTFYSPVVVGALLGIQSFAWMSLASFGWSVVRFIVAGLLVFTVSASAVWGLVGQAIGIFLATALGLKALWSLTSPQESDRPLPRFNDHEYFGYSFMALSGFGLLMNADLLLVKHFFSPELAGTYAKAGIIGRTVVFLPMPIASALFPKVVSEGGMSRVDLQALIHAASYSILIIGVCIGGCALFPWVPLFVLFGLTDPDPELLGYVRRIVWAMGPLGFTFLLTNFELAQHRFKSIGALWVGVLFYVVGVCFWHDSIEQVITLLGVGVFLSMVLLLMGLPWRSFFLLDRQEAPSVPDETNQIE